MEEYNNDIKVQMKNLNKEGLTEEEKRDIEAKIEDDKRNLNMLLKEE